MKVLIVDDCEKMRTVIRTYISDISTDIVECCDGSEALEAYRESRVIIVSQWDDVPIREAARLVGAETIVNKADLLPLRSLLATV